MTSVEIRNTPSKQNIKTDQVENGLDDEEIKNGKSSSYLNNHNPNDNNKRNKFALNNTNLIQKITDSLINGESSHLASHFKKNFNLLGKIIDNPNKLNSGREIPNQTKYIISERTHNSAVISKYNSNLNTIY